MWMWRQSEPAHRCECGQCAGQNAQSMEYIGLLRDAHHLDDIATQCRRILVPIQLVGSVTDRTGLKHVNLNM